MIASVITETRPYDIKQIIERHVKFLPECDVICFHYNNVVNYDCIKYRLPNNVTSLHQYNLLMTSEWYWSKLRKYDRVLVFQNDSQILRKGIEEFLPYDYVGAPIKLCPYPAMNGGLSLRNPALSYEVIKNEIWTPGRGFEDIFFCYEFQKRGYKLAPLEVAKKFSCETMFELGTWGVHAIENYLSEPECDSIKKQYESSNIFR